MDESTRNLSNALESDGKDKLDNLVKEAISDKRSPKAWFFTTSTGAAYDATQTSEYIKDGDVLIVPNEGVAGIMYSAWPIALTSESGQFHRFEPAWNESDEPNKYRESVELANSYIQDIPWHRFENGHQVQKVARVLNRDKLRESGILSPIAREY